MFDFRLDFVGFSGSPESVTNPLKIDPRGHLGLRWLQGGVILSQDGSENRFLSMLHRCLIDFGMDFEVDGDRYCNEVEGTCRRWIDFELTLAAEI